MNQRYQRWRWTTFWITWLIYAGFYFTRQAFSVAKTTLDADPRVAIKREQMGMVDSAYLITYMLGQFVFGPLGDRFGPRRILLCGMGLSIAAAVASGMSTTLTAFVTLAIVQGVAQATGWSNSSKVMSNWFSVSERGRVVGWWCTHYTVGAFAAVTLSGAAMDWWGTSGAGYWPAAFWSAAVVVGVVLLLSCLFLRSRPEDVGLPPIDQAQREPIVAATPIDPKLEAEEGSWALIAEVLSKPSVWLLALSYFPIKMARYCFLFWGPKYVEESLGGAGDTTGLATGMTSGAMPIGGLVGVIALGYISDEAFQARRAPATILSLLATAAVMLVGLWPIHSYWTMCLFFFFVGVFLFGPDSMISATAAMDFGTKRGAGTATGFVNGVGSIGGVLGGYLPSRITTPEDWTPMFNVMLIGLLASALLLLPLWRSKPPTS